MVDYSKKFRDSLTEIMLFLAECANKKFGQFEMLIKNAQRDDTSIHQKSKKRQFSG